MKMKKKKKSRYKKWLTGLALLKLCAISLYLLWGSLIDVLARFHQMFGAVSWLFAILMVALLAEVLQMVFFRSCNSKNLDFIEAVSPPVGLLGTVFALMGGFSNLDLGGMKLEDAITVIVLAIAVSLKTTAAGIIVGLVAMAVRDRLMPVLHCEDNNHQKKEEGKSDALETMDTVGTADGHMVPVAKLR